MEAVSVASAITTLASTIFAYDNMMNQKKSLKSNKKATNYQATLEQQKIQETLAEQQRKNLNLLAQQQSAYKAKLGASGLSHTSGSGQVVLDSMRNEHDMEDKYLQSQANISLDALRNSIEKSNTQNLLQQRNLRNQFLNQSFKDTNSIISAGQRTMLK